MKQRVAWTTGHPPEEPRLNIGDTAKLLAWFERVEARKTKVHPEHPAYVVGCQRCEDFRQSLFTAN